MLTLRWNGGNQIFEGLKFNVPPPPYWGATFRSPISSNLPSHKPASAPDMRFLTVKNRNLFPCFYLTIRLRAQDSMR